MIPKEQIPEIKKQLFKQLENLPEEQKESLKEQIEAMSEKELEEFLIKNKLISAEDQKCIFCQIANKKMNSISIGENKDALAVLEINPISEGHTIIIPKNHIKEKFSEETEKLAKEISDRLQKKLSPKKIEQAKTEMFGHAIINLIPVYENENINTQRKKSNEKELSELKEKIDKGNEKVEEPQEKKEEEKPKPLPKIKSRIP